MLRALAVIGAVGGCAFVGLNASARLRRRRDTLLELIGAVRHILVGVAHSNRPLSQLLWACGEGETGPAFRALAQAVEAGEAPLDAWDRLCLKGEHPLPALMERETKVMTIFFSLLGGSDRQGQIENAQMTINALESHCAEAEASYAAKGKVYRAMGVVLGVGVGILLM